MHTDWQMALSGFVRIVRRMESQSELSKVNRSNITGVCLCIPTGKWPLDLAPPDPLPPHLGRFLWSLETGTIGDKSS